MSAALERSFNEIIRRHEIWRTTFSIVDGEPVQIVHPPTHFALPVVHLEGLPEDQREAEALRLVTEDMRLPFDLARGPLLRPRLIKLDDAEHRLYLTLHHIVFDVASIYDVFMPELAAVYEAFAAGRPSPLAEPAIQYADYAHWQRQRAAGRVPDGAPLLLARISSTMRPCSNCRPTIRSRSSADLPWRAGNHFRSPRR